MKKTYKKVLLRGIRGSISRFLAITCIVALGTGFLSGLMSATTDMKNSADEYYREYNAYDADIKGSLGITEGDIEAIKSQDYVNDAMGIYTVDMLMDVDHDESLEARVIARDLSQAVKDHSINRLAIVEGRLPESSKECLIEVPNKYGFKHKIGEVLTVSENNENYKSTIKDFKHKNFEVVGIVQSPLYVSVNGDVTTVGSGITRIAVYIEPEAYSTEVFTEAYITYNNVSHLPSAENSYKNRVKKYNKELKALGTRRSEIREDSVKGKAERELRRGRRELNEEKEKVYAELSRGKAELDRTARKIEEGKREIAMGRQALEEGKQETDENKKALDELEPVVTQLEAMKETGFELTDRQQGVIDGYYRGREEIEKAEKTLTENLKRLNRESAALDRGEAELASGWTEYEESRLKAEAEFTKAENELDEAAQEINDIQKAKWYYFDRSDNRGISGYATDSEIIDAVAKVFPLFFFMVAILVALTTMTRMIEEERGRIGTLKSLGYTGREIRAHYLFYGFLTSAVGCVIGMALGFKILPAVIADAYSMMYNFPPIETPIIWSLALVIGAVTVAGIMITAYFAAREELGEKPAMLLLPKAPKPGQRILLERIPVIWNHTSFSYKVTLRNLFRYKKHFLMTIVGVAGCVALLMAGFGLRDSIGNIVSKQYDEINKYNIYFEISKEEAVYDDDVRDVLENNSHVTDWGVFHEETVTVSTSADKNTSALKVPKNTDDLKRFITLRERSSKGDIEFNEDSLVITEKMSEQLKVEIGDSVNLKTVEGKEAQAVVTGITENYLEPYVYMSEAKYEKLFGHRCLYKKVLVTTDDKKDNTQDDVIGDLLNCERVDYAVTQNTARQTFDDSIGSIDFIVVVIVACAIALAIIVLYNIANVIICERTKELATLKVLGFFNRETVAYIFREINILALIGIVVGMPVGVWLHGFVVRVAEVEDVMFNRELHFLSFALAAVTTIITVIFINIFMIRSIRKIDMVESMKAND